MNDVIIYEEVKKDGKITLSKTNFKKPDETIKFLYADELDKLLSRIDNEFYQLLFLFIYETGSRVSEALSVKYADVDVKGSRVRLPILKQRRKLYKMLPVSSKLLSMILARHIEYSGEYIFAKKDMPITARAADKAFKKFVIRILGAGYKDRAHIHVLRHTRAIHLADDNVNFMHIKNFLGHANINSTLVYLKFSNKDMEEAIGKVNSKNNLSIYK